MLLWSSFASWSFCSLTQTPPIDKLETSVLSSLIRVEKLSISSNCIDKMVNMPPLKYLTRLSLARNLIKKIQGLEEVAGTLKELWLSYNLIEKLDGISMCQVLQSLYISSKFLLKQTTESGVGTSSTSWKNSPSFRMLCWLETHSTKSSRKMPSTTPWRKCLYWRMWMVWSWMPNSQTEQLNFQTTVSLPQSNDRLKMPLGSCKWWLLPLSVLSVLQVSSLIITRN